jgi:uncharacterized membrane protein
MAASCALILLMPVYLLLPLIAAVIYAVASLFLKKALSEGAHPGWCFHITNIAGTLCFLPMNWFQKTPVDWSLWYHPATTGLMFFVGGVFTFAAMSRGHVSLVTPVLGSKVIFAALGVMLFIGSGMNWMLWTAAALTTLGIFLMGFTDIQPSARQRLLGPVMLSLISAALYAFSDVFIQKWAAGFGRQAFLVCQSVVCGGLSLIASTVSRKLPKLQWNRTTKWMLAGAVLAGLQSLLMGSALGFFNDPVGVNVVYATRGLWSLMIVAWMGPLIGNHERKQSGSGYTLRIIAAVLLLIAVVFAVLARR